MPACTNRITVAAFHASVAALRGGPRFAARDEAHQVAALEVVRDERRGEAHGALEGGAERGVGAALAAGERVVEVERDAERALVLVLAQHRDAAAGRRAP